VDTRGLLVLRCRVAEVPRVGLDREGTVTLVGDDRELVFDLPVVTR
jgi:hypothetical protein